MGVFVTLAREFIAGLYSKDPQVVALAASLMLFVAVFQIFDNPGNGDQHLRAAPRHIHHLCAPV